MKENELFQSQYFRCFPQMQFKVDNIDEPLPDLDENENITKEWEEAENKLEKGNHKDETEYEKSIKECIEKSRVVLNPLSEQVLFYLIYKGKINFKSNE